VFRGTLSEARSLKTIPLSVAVFCARTK